MSESIWVAFGDEDAYVEPTKDMAEDKRRWNEPDLDGDCEPAVEFVRASTLARYREIEAEHKKLRAETDEANRRAELQAYLDRCERGGDT